MRRPPKNEVLAAAIDVREAAMRLIYGRRRGNGSGKAITAAAQALLATGTIGSDDVVVLAAACRLAGASDEQLKRALEPFEAIVNLEIRGGIPGFLSGSAPLLRAAVTLARAELAPPSVRRIADEDIRARLHQLDENESHAGELRRQAHRDARAATAATVAAARGRFGELLNENARLLVAMGQL